MTLLCAETNSIRLRHSKNILCMYGHDFTTICWCCESKAEKSSQFHTKHFPVSFHSIPFYLRFHASFCLTKIRNNFLFCALCLVFGVLHCVFCFFRLFLLLRSFKGRENNYMLVCVPMRDLTEWMTHLTNKCVLKVRRKRKKNSLHLGNSWSVFSFLLFIISFHLFRTRIFFSCCTFPNYDQQHIRLQRFCCLLLCTCAFAGR